MVQIRIGAHSFTFDHVYGSGGAPSSTMFEECISPLIDGLFQGYNATVLAYGQVISIEDVAVSVYSPFILTIYMCIYYRQVLERHIRWELALEMVARQG